MAEQTEEQKRYSRNVAEDAQAPSDMNKTARKVPAHEGETKTTRSTEGSVETTTEKK